MKNKKTIYKIILIILTISIILFIYNLRVYATDDIIKGADDFLDKATTSTLNDASIKSASDMIFSAFSIVGTVIVVIIGAILGIQFIMGSTEEKAKVKETLIPYIIGSVVIFGAVGIWSLAINVFDGIF